VTGRDQVIEWFRALFGWADVLEVVDGTLGEVGSRLYLRWRVSLASSASVSRSLVEQHVFAFADQRITTLDLLCSGFVREPSGCITANGRATTFNY
jgi:hypothetical protein